jgi:hypothetical protein
VLLAQLHFGDAPDGQTQYPVFAAPVESRYLPATLQTVQAVTVHGVDACTMSVGQVASSVVGTL